MYKILVNNEEIALVEEPRYIKVNPVTGVYIQAKNRQHAQGIAVNGTPYNIDGHTEIEGQPEAFLFYGDSGSFIEEISDKVNKQIVGSGSNIATQNYPEGECIVMNDTLYKVIEPIARGEKFIVDENIKPTTVMQEVNELKGDN